MRAVKMMWSASILASCGSDVPQLATSAEALAPYSETNNQVAGVDEADRVETDGRHIFTLAGDELCAVAAYPPQEMKLAGDLKLAGRPQQMFLADYGRIAVLSELENGMVEATIVEAADPSELRVLRSFRLPGAYRGARRIGNIVYAVVTGSPSPPEESCTGFCRATAPIAVGSTTIGAIDLVALSLDRTTILGYASAIHMSAGALYVANDGMGGRTFVHKLVLEGGVRHEVSGVLDGRLPDRASMDEHRGMLRAVTTLEGWSRISVMAPVGEKLEVVSVVEPLGKGAEVDAVRFAGSRAIVSTGGEPARMYIVDLTRPKEPIIESKMELSAPIGYLHMLDPDHLLAVGTETLSIFDLGIRGKPIEVHTQLIGRNHGWTEASAEPLAFNYFEQTKMLALPYVERDPQATSDLRLFKIDPAGIRVVGALDMSDLRLVQQFDGWSWIWSPWIRRSVMIGEYVYAVSDAGVRAAPVWKAAHPIATVTFDGVIPR